MYSLLIALVIAAVAFFAYLWWERFSKTNNEPSIICPTESLSVSVESLSDHSMLLRDVTAIDPEDGDITASLVVESVSQFVEDKHCIVTYAAFDSSNNVTKLSRHIFLTDYISPRFQIIAPLEFSYSSSFNPLSAVRAIDCIDGDISDRIRMSLVNPDDNLTSVGTHLVEFKVTNSLGDVSVLETEINVYDRTYTETRQTPVIELTDYIVYLDSFGNFDALSYVKGITLGGVFYTRAEYSAGRLTVDDVGIDYNVPGVYKILYTCSNKEEYVGSAVLLVVVTGVND
ncbi:MAG: hypothetical protein J5854_04515 [Clostridia bacterium]|nr:hypothetical protein [Clostridia bacterium]